MRLTEDGDYLIIVNPHAGDNATTAQVTNCNLTVQNGNMTLIKSGYSRSTFGNGSYSSASMINVYVLKGAKANDILTANFTAYYSVACYIMAIKL